MQYGAGCQSMPDTSTPLCLYCDNFSQNTFSNAFSDAAQLCDAECEVAIANEGRV